MSNTRQLSCDYCRSLNNYRYHSPMSNEIPQICRKLILVIILASVLCSGPFFGCCYEVPACATFWAASSFAKSSSVAPGLPGWTVQPYTFHIKTEYRIDQGPFKAYFWHMGQQQFPKLFAGLMKAAQEWGPVAENVFLFVYTIEILMRLVAGRRDYFRRLQRELSSVADRHIDIPSRKQAFVF